MNHMMRLFESLRTEVRSSMTLFASITANDSIYQQTIDKYFWGKPDQISLDILASSA